MQESHLLGAVSAFADYTADVEFHQPPKTFPPPEAATVLREGTQPAPSRKKTSLSLCNDFRNDTGTDCSAALTDSKTKSLLDSDRRDELNGHIDVVAGAAHLNTVGKLNNTGNVGGSEIELRSVAAKNGFLRPPSFSVKT